MSKPKSGLGLGELLIGIGILSLVLPLCNLQFTVTKGVGIATGLPLICVSLLLIISGVVVLFIGQARKSVSYSTKTFPIYPPSYSIPAANNAKEPNLSVDPFDLDKAEFDKIVPYANEMIQRLNMEEPFDQMVADIALKSGTRKEQVITFIAALVNHLEKARQAKSKASEREVNQGDPEDDIPF